jgi:hypothetical protein
MNSDFYEAVDCVIHGRIDALRTMLEADPDLAAARSTMEHRATLLHYVAANGVEDELQKTPPNAVDVARALLDAGADVDATCEVYGGGPDTTPLVSLVTSGHPKEAGVQADLVELFCNGGGARVNGLEDNGMPIAMALSFFYPKAAAALARSGARIDNAVFAAGVGDRDRMLGFLDGDQVARYCQPFDGLEDPNEIATTALSYAALGGHLSIIELLLGRGVSVNASTERNIHGADVVALHMAAAGGHMDAVELLIEREADIDRPDGRWGSTPGFWAHLGGYEAIAERLGHGKTNA